MIINGGIVNLNNTINGGTHSVGGSGLTVKTSATARITGAGGDQIYDGADPRLQFHLHAYKRQFTRPRELPAVSDGRRGN